MLHSDLEEMSLGSDASTQAELIGSKDQHKKHANTIQPSTNSIKVGGSFLDGSFDDLFTNTDNMPDLDARYTSKSDPEGGAPG